ncbi:MAG: alpha/beta hydrolase [Chitinophagaceae bacterium]|nr:MAG: alpha/beta hydrolase [Chitinophagaceae bacterium]
MTVYFISGLGADRRVFERLRLPENFRAVHLDWIAAQPGETLAGYALRLAEGIDASEPFALVGLSMGGMIATELAKVLQPEKTVLLSSATSVHSLPLLTRIAGALRAEQFVPASWIKTPSWLAYRMQGANDEASRQLLRALLHDIDKAFLLWAMRAILTWKNKTVPPGIIRIHGSADRIIPCKRVPADHVVNGAGHLMVFTHAEQVSEILERIFR